jgi:Protein of unknown function (DUF1097)
LSRRVRWIAIITSLPAAVLGWFLIFGVAQALRLDPASPWVLVIALLVIGALLGLAVLAIGVQLFHLRSSRRYVLRAPIDRVFASFDNTENIWTAGIRSIRPLTNGPRAAGFQAEIELANGRRVRETVVDHDPPSLIGLEIRTTGGRLISTTKALFASLEPSETEVRLTSTTFATPLTAVLIRMNRNKIESSATVFETRMRADIEGTAPGGK